MAGKASETLFELIKSLTKSEKRYFKIISSRHTIGEENNYIVLFDYLAQQEEYDEEAIFIHFKGEAFLNRFAITKKRLYDHILSSLDAFHITSSIDAQLYKMIHSCDILYNKALYDQCKKLLRSAEKFAQKHERFNILAEISKKQKRLVESKGQLDDKEIEEILQNDKQFHAQSLLYDKIWNLKSRLFLILSSKGVSRTKNELENFKTIIDDLLLAAKQEELTFESTYLYHHIYSAYYFAINDFQNSFKHLQENVAHIQSRAEYIIENPNHYFSILTNAIYLALKLKENLIAQDYLRKLKSLTKDYAILATEDFNIKLFSSTSSIELSVLTMRGDFDEALKSISIIEHGLLMYDEKLTPIRKAFLYFKIASIYFIVGDLHAALKWINRILSDSSIDEREDLISFTHIMSLLIHFEMKNESLIPYTMKTVQRYLKSRNRLYGVESLVLKHITKISKVQQNYEREDLFEKLYKELSVFENDQLERIAFEYFDFVSWAKARATQKELKVVLKEKGI
jgi:hypothetical protein